MGSNASPRTERQWVEALADELRRLEEQSLRRYILAPDTGQLPRAVVNGQEYSLFTSNNYLGLGSDPRLIRASAEATERYGTSVSASRLLYGSTPIHEELEARLAGLKAQEGCLLYSSGYLANVGVLACLVEQDDVIFSDELNHASIVDGCRLSRARHEIYRHRDLDHLESLLARSRARRRIIVSESVFSMDGDLAPVPELVALAERHGALLVIDEAHSTGLLGSDGGGVLSHFGVQPGSPVLIVGTLSKALGSVGGFVAAGKTVISYLVNRSRTFIFDTALAPGAVGAALAALDVLALEPWRRERVLALAGSLRSEFGRRGYPATGSVSQIVPLMLGEAKVAVEMEERLRAGGVLARAIRPPTVPEGTSRIRFNVMATHDESDLERVLAALP